MPRELAACRAIIFTGTLGIFCGILGEGRHEKDDVVRWQFVLAHTVSLPAGGTNMQPIKAPKQDGDYDDRFLDCQEAIENKIQQVMEEAIRAGWTREEAAAALVEVADLVMELAIENRKDA